MKNIFFSLVSLLVWQIGLAQWTGAVEDTLTRNSLREETRRQSLAVDDLNTLHILYVRDNGGAWDLVYRKRPQHSGWGPETVIAPTPSPNAALAVDRLTGKAWAAWEQPGFSGTDILLAGESAGSWTPIPVTTGLTQNSDPAIAVDGEGDVHLAWIREVAAGVFQICYAQNKSGNFQVHVLSGSSLGPFGSGASPCLVADQIGRVHIAYRGGNFGSYRIHVAFNTSPADTNWQYRILTTPNAEDLSASIGIDRDTVIHLLSSGNDGFGFPTRTHYMTKPSGAVTFGSALPVAVGFSAGLGDLFVTPAGSAHAVMDEISGNIYTGNVLYADANGGWNGSYLLQNGDDYGSNLVLDEAGFGYCAVYSGNAFADQEIVVYGRTFTTGIPEADPGEWHAEWVSETNSLRVTGTAFPFDVIRMYDACGRLLAQEEFPATHELEMPLPGWKVGIYFVVIGNGGINAARKLIID